MSRADASRPHVLVIEDNPTTSKTLVIFLEAAGYDATCAFNGHDGKMLFRTGSYDLVLLDLMLPDIDGLTVCRMIRKHSSTPVVMLTAKTTEDDIVEGLESGADDYVCKPFGSKELLARIRLCLSRVQDAGVRGGLLRVGAIELDAASRKVAVSGRPVRLTKTEFGILNVLMRNPGRVFTRDQLINQALGPGFNGYDRTIDTHIWSLRKKIGEERRKPKYILSELGFGYRMSDGDAP